MNGKMLTRRGTKRYFWSDRNGQHNFDHLGSHKVTFAKTDKYKVNAFYNVSVISERFIFKR